jgi:hypothetical protein
MAGGAAADPAFEAEVRRREGVRTFLYDRAGFGQSPATGLPYRIDDEADALRRELDVIVSVPHLTLRSDRDGGGAIFRALALLQPSHERVVLPAERTSIVFSLGGADERKTA